ncbi:PREDICTED: farnesyl pyrophosphate synthase-like [Papilio polytes]|uniref:farnesyl pyrophosphate synthase-like n=1 Tax=Papilio polytes TaxID=76194 RepID=UPI0006761716|nr:PREDICTED: farnesyl pyrophosphate synthase-like [Papilio polytes]
MLSLILCGKDNEPTFERIRDIVRDVGALYQMMNDYTDLTNVESKAGKTSSDIQEGKCTFYAVNTMLRATPEQKEIFKASYGSWDPEDVKRIRKLYKDLDLISYYKEQHNSKYKQFMKNLDELPSDDLLTPELFLKMMEASNLNNWEIY